MTEQNNTFGASTEQGVIQIILCWTVNGEEDFMKKVWKAARLVADQVFNCGDWIWYDGQEVVSQLFVYREPNNTYTVYLDDEDEAVGRFGF